MNRFLKQTGLWAVLLISLLSFTSCVEDDVWTRDTLKGTWRVVETSGGYGHCPYNVNDRFAFDFNGFYNIWGYYGDYSEQGYWELDNGRIYLDASYDGSTDVELAIRQIDNGYLVLDVWDYTYNSRYTLRLVRVGY